MEPRLSRLVELWSQSLESDLDAHVQGELQGLMADANLVEQFTEYQIEHSPAEAVDAVATPHLDQRMKAWFHRRVLAQRFLPWFLGGSAVAVVVYLSGLGETTSRYTMVSMAEKPAGLHETVAESVRPKKARSLGLPPGYGSRPTRLELRVGHQAQMNWRLAEAGVASVRVMGPDGGVYRTLWRGAAEAGNHHTGWDGTDGAGRQAPLGRYRLVVEADGTRVTEQVVDLNRE